MKKEKSIYLLGHYAMRPRKGVRTTVKGWMDDTSNLQYDESVEITRGERKGALSAKIILNLSEKTVVKNTFNGKVDFKDLFKYFFSGYHNYMTTVMAQIDPTYMEEIVAELTAEMEAAKAEEAAAAAIPTVIDAAVTEVETPTA